MTRFFEKSDKKLEGALAASRRADLMTIVSDEWVASSSILLAKWVQYAAMSAIKPALGHVMRLVGPRDDPQHPRCE